MVYVLENERRMAFRKEERKPMKILYPPRPKGKIHPTNLAAYESTNRWVFQRKFNGTRNLIYVPKDHDPKGIFLLSRHGTPHRQFQLTKSLTEQILSLNLKAGKDYWLDGELLHNKTTDPHYKNRIVLYDVLQEGRYLYGLTLMQRLALLADVCRNPTSRENKHGIALEVTPNLWLAETFATNFLVHYGEFIHIDEIEGGVLKRKESSLDNAGSKMYETSWLIRCRKPHAGGSYSH